MTKHTPTPWTADLGGCITSSGLPIVTGRNGALLATLAMNGHKGAANADFIVRAVNAHDELVAALRRMMEQPTMNPLNMTPEQRVELWAAHDQARAALAKAQG